VDSPQRFSSWVQRASSLLSGIFVRLAASLPVGPSHLDWIGFEVHLRSIQNFGLLLSARALDKKPPHAWGGVLLRPVLSFCLFFNVIQKMAESFLSNNFQDDFRVFCRILVDIDRESTNKVKPVECFSLFCSSLLAEPPTDTGFAERFYGWPSRCFQMDVERRENC